MYAVVKKFVADERGLETVEYAIITGLIVTATIGLMITIGGRVKDKFQILADSLSPSG